MNLHRYLRRFHDEHAMMSKFDLDRIRRLRDTVQDRLVDRLFAAERPAVHRWLPQGSYAMNTMVRNTNNGEPDMDIDVGVVFRYEDLIDRYGSGRPPDVIKRWVSQALQQGNLSRSPRVRRNCVSVWYGGGEQIDLPVYRLTRRYNGDEFLELASESWTLSDPEGVNDWFADNVSGAPQLRRLVRLFKVLGRRQVPRLSGFAITSLVVQHYHSVEDRDDLAFYATAKQILAALQRSVRLEHPVLLGRLITKHEDDVAAETFLERLSVKLEILSTAFRPGTNAPSALRAWRHVFQHPFFSAAAADSV
jgi:hypothetical protein